MHYYCLTTDCLLEYILHYFREKARRRGGRAKVHTAEMLSVSGVGENKYERYGERFLSVIMDYTGGIREKFYFGEE